MGSDDIFFLHYNLFRFYEEKEIFRIVGVTFVQMKASSALYSNILGYRNILPEAMEYESDWLVIVMADDDLSKQLVAMLENAGVSEKKIIPYRVLLMWGIDLEKYLMLKENPPTVFSNNCMGGLFYNRAGLKFLRNLPGFRMRKSFVLFRFQPANLIFTI